MKYIKIKGLQPELRYTFNQVLSDFVECECTVVTEIT